MLEWRSSGNSDEPADQDADSDLVAHGYWAVGPNGPGLWSSELIEREDPASAQSTWGVDLGNHPTEAAAKAAAQHYEDTHERSDSGIIPRT